MKLWVILTLAAVFFVWMSFKWNNIRTKFAFFFILFGVLLMVLFGYLVVTGSSFDFATLGGAVSSMRVYFLWMKSLIVNIFEVTGKAIGLI